MKNFKIFSLLFLLITFVCENIVAVAFNAVLAGSIALAVGINPIIAIIAWNVLAVRFSKPKTSMPILRMAIQKEIWADTLIKLFWKSNAFAGFSVKAQKEFIYGGKIVHIPQVVTAPTVTRNRTSFPATVADRTDAEILYLIDEFYVDPFRIPNAENYELSFPKRASVVQDQSNAANQSAADWLLKHWASYTQTTTAGTTTMNAQQLRTTGGDVASHLSGTTGNRKLLLVADLKKAKVLLNNGNVPTGDRYALFDSDMIDQLTQDVEYKKAEKVYENELVEGTVAKIQGFNIIERSTSNRYDNAGTPAILLPSAASAAATNSAGLLWHSQGVENAIGDVEFFQEEKSPTYYGDIYSAILRAGGRLRRTDSVISLIQAAGS